MKLILLTTVLCLLVSCSYDVSPSVRGKSIKLAEELCASHEGILILRASNTTGDNQRVEVLCNNGTYLEKRTK